MREVALEARTDTKWYSALASLQVLDVATTWFILQHWGERAEGNPVVAAVISGAGLPLAMMTILVIKLTVVYALYRKETGVKIISAIYGLVIVNNLLFIILWLLGGST